MATRLPGSGPPRRGRDDGAVTVEMLVAIPILTFIVFTVVQAALWGWALVDVHAAADGAARDGARYGATLDDARTSALTRLHATAGLLSGEHVTATETATAITVTITGHSSLLPIPIHCTVTVPRETFTTGPTR